jgi:Outer membrane protein beta-barrel domain
MKKSLFTVVALLSVSLLAAQEVKFGAKAGLNLSTVKTTVDGDIVPTNLDNKFLVGFHLGGFAELKITDKFAFQPELIFSLQGAKTELDNTISITPFPGVNVTDKYEEKNTLKTSYLNIPLLAKFYATEKLFFVAGPQLGFLLSAKLEGESTSTEITTGLAGGTTTDVTKETFPSEDVKKGYKGVNFALGLGGGYFFTENLFAEARYNLGLSNDYKEEDTADPTPVTYKTSAIQLSVGYRF